MPAKRRKGGGVFAGTLDRAKVIGPKAAKKLGVKGAKRRGGKKGGGGKGGS